MLKKNQNIKFNTLENYTIQNKINSGAFSNIYSCNNPNYIIKVIEINQSTILKIDHQSYNNETCIYNLLNPDHPNIVNCHSFKKDNNYGYILLEYCPNGSLLDYLAKLQTLSEGDIISMVYQIAQGLNFMHSKRIAHRDIKLENILISKNLQLKICDFGSSLIGDSTISKENLLEIQLDIEKNTTPNYRSPEQTDLWSGFKLGTKVDCWALGCILFILCFKKPPFESRLAILSKHIFIPDNSEYSQILINVHFQIS